MGLNQFDYPDKTAPTTTLIFDHAHLINDDTLDVEFNQSTELTKGGTRYVESWGAAKEVFPLTIIVPKTKTGTEAQYSELRAFLIATVNGAENTFVWTDEDGTARTVRITDSSLSFKDTGKHYKIPLTLEAQ